MNVLPSPNVYEGDIVEVVCKVVSQLQNVEVYLTMDKKILKQALVSLSHRFVANVEHSGELACKAVWENIQKKTSQSIKVKGKYAVVRLFFLKSSFPQVGLPPERFIANVLENDCGCPAPTELFSKPNLTLKPTDIFNGDTFRFECSISIFLPERINKDTVKYSYYKDNVNITSSQTYISMAHPSKNGNYTCKVQAQSLAHSFVKESQIIVLNTKGESDFAVLIATVSALVWFFITELSSVSSEGFKGSPECGGGDAGVGKALPDALSQ